MRGKANGKNQDCRRPVQGAPQQSKTAQRLLSLKKDKSRVDSAERDASLKKKGGAGGEKTPRGTRATK